MLNIINMLYELVCLIILVAMGWVLLMCCVSKKRRSAVLSAIGDCFGAPIIKKVMDIKAKVTRMANDDGHPEASKRQGDVTMDVSSPD